MPGPERRSGLSCVAGQVSPVRPTRGDRLVTASQAARLVGVTPKTIRNWRDRELLSIADWDEHGWELFHKADVRWAEAVARELGRQAIGTDPRRLRKPKPRAKVAA